MTRFCSGPGQVDRDHVAGRAVLFLAVGRHDPQVVVILDQQPGAVAADGEPVELLGQLGDLALAQVVALPLSLDAATEAFLQNRVAAMQQAILAATPSGWRPPDELCLKRMNIVA